MGGRHECLQAAFRSPYRSCRVRFVKKPHFKRHFDGDSYARSGNERTGATPRRPYATAAAVQAIRPQLSERDLAIIDTLGMVTVASSMHLEELHFDQLKASSRARQRSNVLNRLTKLGLLARLPRRVGGIRAGSSGYVFALDLLGQRLFGTTNVRRPPSRSWPYLRHALAVTDLYAQTVAAERNGRLELLRFSPEPRCWNLIEGDISVRPDAIISTRPTIGDWRDHWAVEVDRATERPVRLRQKLLGYYQAFQAGSQLSGTSVFPKVLLTVPDEARLEECLRIIDRLPIEAAELVVPVLHHEAVKVLASGGPS